jgi:hypothetical protein
MHVYLITVPIPRDFLRSVWGVKYQQKRDEGKIFKDNFFNMSPFLMG